MYNLFSFLFLQRSEYELSDCDSYHWTECAQSVETLRKPGNEKCAESKKPAKAEVRKSFSVRYQVLLVVSRVCC